MKDQPCPAMRRPSKTKMASWIFLSPAFPMARHRRSALRARAPHRRQMCDPATYCLDCNGLQVLDRHSTVRRSM